MLDTLKTHCHCLLIPVTNLVHVLRHVIIPESAHPVVLLGLCEALRPEGVRLVREDVAMALVVGVEIQRIYMTMGDSSICIDISASICIDQLLRFETT
jgi:hypothetical protein